MAASASIMRKERPRRSDQGPRAGTEGARIRGNRPVGQSEAADRFIAALEHEKMHDEWLWDLRRKRDREMHGIPEWESSTTWPPPSRNIRSLILTAISISSRQMREQMASMCIGCEMPESTTELCSTFSKAMQSGSSRASRC